MRPCIRLSEARACGASGTSPAGATTSPRAPRSRWAPPSRGRPGQAVRRCWHGWQGRSLVDLALLHGVSAGALQLAGLVTGLPGCLQLHLGIAAQSEALLLACDGVLAKPALRSSRRHFEVETPVIGEPRTRLLLRRAGCCFASDFGEHVGEQDPRIGTKSCPFPSLDPLRLCAAMALHERT